MPALLQVMTTALASEIFFPLHRRGENIIPVVMGSKLLKTFQGRRAYHSSHSDNDDTILFCSHSGKNSSRDLWQLSLTDITSFSPKCPKHGAFWRGGMVVDTIFGGIHFSPEGPDMKHFWVEKMAVTRSGHQFYWQQQNQFLKIALVTKSPIFLQNVLICFISSCKVPLSHFQAGRPIKVSEVSCISSWMT